MLKKLAVSTFLYCLLLPALSPAFGLDLSKEDSLVFRFTGPEAQKLTDFLKARSRLKQDFSPTRFYGDPMSLACSELSDCYLWLSRKEWQAENSSASSVLTFTLPINQTTLSGQLTLTPGPSATHSNIQLKLQDLYYPGTYSFTQALNCPVVPGKDDQDSLQGNGDCRLELSTAAKKKLPYQGSVQYIQNIDNIILNFNGPWARHLFTNAQVSSVDPLDAKRLRAQLGPNFYCWNIDPLEQQRFVEDPYVCQGKFSRQDREPLRFSDQGTLKDNKEFTVSLTPAFRNELLQDLELRLHTEGKDWSIAHCLTGRYGTGHCTVFYDLNMATDGYPIGNAVQGVAVGWGVVKEKEVPRF